MPSAPTPAAAQLTRITNPLGGARPATTAAAPVSARASMPQQSASFDDLLAQQLGGAGALGSAGALGGGSDPMSQLASLLQGGSSGAGALGQDSVIPSMAALSPQMARAIAAANAGASSGPTPGATPAGALTWAKSRMGREEWNNLCERFVEEAYGTRSVYTSAAEASRAMSLHRGSFSWETAPVGSLLYFAGDASNDYNGHAGIYLGNGHMISATPKGVQEESLETPYYADRYIGWADPGQLRAAPRRAASRSSAVNASPGAFAAPRPVSRVSNPVTPAASSGLLPSLSASGLHPSASSATGSAVPFARTFTTPAAPASARSAPTVAPETTAPLAPGLPEAAPLHIPAGVVPAPRRAIPTVR